MNIEASIITIVSEVLDLDKLKLSEESGIDDFEEWDSMATINIMTIICQEYSIVPSFDDFENFTSVKLIIKFIKKSTC
ncbi:acyl carrier protein [Vibrio coralliirubri]|uniref:acyl carrier protein n=1 Tax=Vibrio coralliirubri TaxID=1516159 RepID=UPI002FDFBF4C